MQVIRTLSIVIVLAACAVMGRAQSTATVSGIVKDPSGALLPGAQVTVRSAATDAVRTATSDSAGNYVVPSLEPGEYTVQVKASGFSLYTVRHFVLQVDQAAALNISLGLESAGETIEVTSGAPVIDAASITVGQVIDKETVQEIPLNGRHFLDLTVLTPGGVTAPATGSLTAPSRGLGANSFVTAGNREDSVNFQINGVNLNDMSQNQITFQPSINTTSEMKINNSTYSAEYGRSSGSIVNVSTRSGTNKFHGEVFDYLRNEALDARNFFNVVGQPKNTLKRNNFGGALGGPIWHDKTFFFASYEGLRQRQGLLLSGQSNLSQSQAAGVTDTVIKNLLPLLPAFGTTNSFAGVSPGPVQTDQGTMDVMQIFSPKDTLHGFYALQWDTRTEPNLQGNTLPGFGDHRVAHRQVMTVNETHVFSSRFVNEARLGFNRIAIQFLPNFTTTSSSLGFNNFPTGISASVGIPQVTISGLSLNIGGPSGFPQGRNDSLGVFSDTANYTVGRHAIKFGGEFRRFLNANFGADTGSVGFAETPAIAGVQAHKTAIQNFQAGQAATFSINPNPNNNRLYSNSAGGFLMDNFKLTPAFMIEAGLRFEWNGSPVFGNNKASIFDPASVSLYQIGTFGFGEAYKQNYNYEPRVGFTYDVFGTGKTVLRGGFGLMADQPQTGVATALASNAPFSNKVSYTATQGATTTTASPLPTIPVESLYARAAASSISIAATQLNLRNAYTETFNLNLQHELPGGVALSVGYYGSVGRHLRNALNINQINPGTGTRAFTRLAATSPFAPNASIASNISQISSLSSSNYNAMWLTARKNISHGVQFSFTWNYTKSMDLGSLSGTQFQDATNPRSNYGLSDFDVRHRIASNAIYDLPFHQNRLVSGFRLAGIAQWQTGNPLNITTLSTYTGTSGLLHPNLIAPIAYAKTYVQPTPTSVQVNWFAAPATTVCNTATAGCIFQLPATGFGNMQRNGARGPGFANIDMSLEKNTKLTERVTFQLRADAFDIFNHASFGNPGTSAVTNSASFGVITATRFPVADLGSSRQLQFAGKFLF